jgi:peptide/nickel transport system permease protein
VIRYVLRRSIHSIGVAFVVVVLVFFVGRMVGDPARLMLPVDALPEQFESLRERLGLNEPLLTQFFAFLGGAMSGDFGDSFWQKVPALDLVLSRLPATLLLAAATMAIALPSAILLGALAVHKPGSWADRAVNVASLSGVSIVDFWLGLMLILIFSVQLGWLPTSGYGGIEYIILPAVVLAASPLGRIAQITRSALLDEMSKPYIRAARAKGMTRRRAIFRHGLKNAFVPIITMAGDETTSVLNGAVVIEAVFAWPGVGLLLIQAIQRRDLPLIEATVLVVAVLVIITNLLVDLAYAYLNPRIRYS